MARINMELIVDELDENFTKVLKAVVDEAAPDNNADARQIMRIFRVRLERGFGHWEHVSERCVDTGYQKFSLSVLPAKQEKKPEIVGAELVPALVIWQSQ